MGGRSVKKSRFRFWLSLSLLWMGVIVLHSCMPASTSNAESRGVLAVVQMFLPWMTHGTLRSLAHFFCYLVLGLFVTATCRNAKNFSLLKPLALCQLAALCDETIQRFTPGRAGELRDLWVDFGGALLGSLVLWLIYKLRKR